MPSIARKQALCPLKLKREKMDVPELGEGAYVWVRELAAKEVITLREQFGKTVSTEVAPFNFEVMAYAAVDDDGKRIFESGNDVAENFEGSAATVQAIAEKAVKLSGMDLEKKTG